MFSINFLTSNKEIEHPNFTSNKILKEKSSDKEYYHQDGYCKPETYLRSSYKQANIQNAQYNLESCVIQESIKNVEDSCMTQKSVQQKNPEGGNHARNQKENKPKKKQTNLRQSILTYSQPVFTKVKKALSKYVSKSFKSATGKIKQAVSPHTHYQELGQNSFSVIGKEHFNFDQNEGQIQQKHKQRQFPEPQAIKQEQEQQDSTDFDATTFQLKENFQHA